MRFSSAPKISAGGDGLISIAGPGRQFLWPWFFSERQRAAFGSGIDKVWPKISSGFGPPGPQAIAQFLACKTIEVEVANKAETWTQQIQRGQTLTRSQDDSSDVTETTGTALDGSSVEHRLSGGFGMVWNASFDEDFSFFFSLQILPYYWVYSWDDSAWFGQMECTLRQSEWNGSGFDVEGWATPAAFETATLPDRIQFSGFGSLGNQGVNADGTNPSSALTVSISKVADW